jgi:hypothetical protein
VELIRNRPFGWWLGVADTGPAASGDRNVEADILAGIVLWRLSNPRLSSGGFGAIPESRRSPCCFAGRIAPITAVPRQCGSSRKRTYD